MASAFMRSSFTQILHEYEYEINAKTGKIRDMDVEHFDYDDDWD